MRHTLQKLAGLAFRGVVRPWPAAPSLPKAPPSLNPKTPFYQRSQTIFTTSSIRNAPHPSFIDETSSSQNEHEGSGPKSLSPAVQGRAASSAIRQLIKVGNVADAYLIVNSVRYAASPAAPNNLFGVNFIEQFRSVALAFTPDVSPRLPSHSLLHGLLRLGMADKASDLASQMISTGIRVRCKTIEAIYSGLIHASQAKPTAKILPTHAELESPNVLDLDPSRALDKRSGFAIRLLGLARQSRQRRSHKMFKLLMTLCVINGEIIFASLLFGVLVRDWQARNAHAIEDHTTPEPTQHHIIDVCRLASEHIASLPTTPSAELQYQSGLQALAILANLLDRHIVEMQHIPSLISSLYKCPRGPAEVWIPGDDGNPIRVHAYSYFQEVLDRLIDSIWERTFQEPKPPLYISPVRKDDAIALDHASCNTLLAYALINRYSIPLAAKVWRYMMDMRFTPDHVTHGILDRAGRTLDLTPLRTSDNLIEVEDLVRVRDTGDNYSLDAHLRRVIADGRLNTLMSAIPSLLPGFVEETFTDLQLGKSEAAARTAHLGPVVFGAFLTGLCKAGHFYWASKLFLWIRLAESHSWQPDEQGVVTPWCIPIQLYTNMIQLYEKKAQRERRYGSRVKPYRQYRITPREYAMELYRMVKPAAQNVERSLAALQDTGVTVNVKKNFLNIPRPDKPFFNAILQAVGRRDIKGKQQPNSYYHRQFRKALKEYLETGRLRPEPEPGLVEIANDIINAGIPIPLLYRPSLVGRIPTEKFGKADDDWPGISSIPYSKWKATEKKQFPLQQHLAMQEFGPVKALTG